MVVDCPNCGQQTTLTTGSKSKAHVLIISVAALLFIVVVVAASLLRFLPSKSTPTRPVVTNAAPPKPAPEPVAVDIVTNQFRIGGKITIEKAESGGIRYAVGSVKNESNQQRFGVKIMLDELGQQGNKVGNASDYAAVIEPGKEWRFRALLTQPRTTAVRLAGIGEQK